MDLYTMIQKKWSQKKEKIIRGSNFFKSNAQTRQWLTAFSIILGLLGTASAYGRELWSADFESPDYIVNTYLTGQQDWWHYQGWSAGQIVSSGTGQRAKIGGTNGWGETVLTPWIQDETTADKRFRILMTVTPGSGSNPFKCRIMDNIQNAVINVWFDASTAHIMVKGGDNADWVDTGVAYVGGTDYKLEIIKADSSWTFDLKVDGVWAARNIASRNPISVTGGAVYNTVPGIGYLYLSGGGNGGEPLASAFTYIDDMKIEAIPDYDRLWIADFESPPYTLNAILTGQQGWWHYQDWSQGLVSSYSQSQRVCMGGSNGYPHLVLSPWISEESSSDKYFRILATVTPGTGSNSLLMRVLDNGQMPVININFDKASGNKILAKGTDSDQWIDTGVVYTPCSDCQIEVVQNSQTNTFNLSIDSQMVLRDVPNNVSTTGFGYLYLLAGGNDGVPITDQYTYIDDVSVDIVPAITTLWSADFETYPYVLNSTLTGQQGWWHYQGWTQGSVVSTAKGQRACLGGSNGYPHKVLSPWINQDNDGDKRFRILATVAPGAGSNSFLLRVLDNGQLSVINVNFDLSSGKIQAKGTDSAQWIDTGVTYTPGADYRLEILQDNETNTFSLCINEDWVLRDVSTGVTCNGIGYIYVLAGGNDGTPISNQYSYMDDLSVQVLPEAEQDLWPLGAWDRLDSVNVPTDLASEGANMTVAYWYPTMSDLQVRSWLDEAYLNDIKVILEPPRVDGYISPDTTLITNYVNKFKNHPAVCGWYIADEPPINDTDAYNTIKAGYDLIKTLDSKPVFICFTIDGIPAADIPATFNTYADAYDIMLFDCYITVKDTPEFNYIITSTFQGRIDLARSYANAAGKSWRAVLQGYGRTSNTNQWWARLPTINELKFMLYYSIEKDAKGWFSWCHFLCKEETYAYASDPYPYDGRQWIDDVYKPLASEINTLGAALNNGKKSGLTDNKSEVLSSLYQHPQTLEYYILAVNNYNGSNTATFTINSTVGTFASAQPLFEGRGTISIANGEFSDQFSLFGVHVYKLIQ